MPGAKYAMPTDDPEQVELIKEAYKIWEDTMMAKGFKVFNYAGKFYYRGPAIKCKDHTEFGKAVAASPFETQYDECGRNGFIVYPAYTIYPDDEKLRVSLGLTEDVFKMMKEKNKCRKTS